MTAASRTSARLPRVHRRESRRSGSNSSFYQDTVRETKQTAFFASVDYDLIPKVLTPRSARAISASTTPRRAASASFGCFEQGAPAGGCQVMLQPQRRESADTESGFKSRGNLTWHITPDLMVYYTYSQGFRPGGFNQNGGSDACLHGPDWCRSTSFPRRTHPTS
jgi:iron complex outermembrane receptor protein